MGFHLDLAKVAAVAVNRWIGRRVGIPPMGPRTQTAEPGQAISAGRDLAASIGNGGGFVVVVVEAGDHGGRTQGAAEHRCRPGR